MARRPRTTRAAKQEEVADDITNSGEDESGILEFDQNLDEFPEPENLPEGMYVGEIQEVEVRTNQKGTGKYFAIRWLIPPDQFPPDYDTENWPEGCLMYYNLLKYPEHGDRRAISNVRKFMEKIGLSVATNRIDINEWLNQSAKLKVQHGEWQGEARAEIAPGGIEVAD